MERIEAIVDKLMADGKLPNIRRVIEGGVRSTLLSLEDYSKSPAIWNTIYTGRLPKDHGIEDFLAPADNAGKTTGDRIGSIHRKVPALWNMLSMSGFSIDVIGLWATYPAEKVNGVMITDHSTFLVAKPQKRWNLTSAIERELTFPPGIFERMRGHMDRSVWVLPPVIDNSLGRLVDLRSNAHKVDFTDFHDHDVDHLRQIFQEDYLKAGMGLELLAESPPDLYINYFRGTDVSQHFFWRYYEPDRFTDSPGTQELFGNLIGAYYEYADEIVGRHLELLDPKDSLIIISDHGGRPFPGHPAEILWNKIDPSPKWRDRRQNLFLALDFKYPGSDAGEGLLGVSLGKNSGNNEFMLRIDPVAAGLPLADLHREVVGRVEEMKLLPSGKPLFALRSESENPSELLVFDSKNHRLISFSTEVEVRGKKWSMGELFRIKKRSGDHRREGVFIGYGRDFGKGKVVEDMSVEHISPLLLALFGLPRDVNMIGSTPLGALEGKAWGLLKKQGTIDYSAAWQKKTGTAVVDQEFMENLKALGYLDG